MGNDLTERILKVLQNMRHGTHLCHFYQTPQDMLDVLVPYLTAGLARNEKCLWIVDGILTVAQAEQAMADAVPDWKERSESGQIEIVEHTDWYVKNGCFDRARVIQQFVDHEATALEAGFTGLRVTGNTVWAQDGMWSDLLEYERHIDQTLRHHRISAVCTYPLAICSAADVVDVAKAHELVLIRRDGVWDIIESATLRHMRQELRENHERLKSLTHQMVHLEQKERRRVSQALHDGLQQTIVGTQLNLARVKDSAGFARDEVIDRIAELLDEALTACRTLTTEISPPILHDRGLLPALQWLRSWFQQQHALTVHIHLPPHEPHLGINERVTLFEVCREMLFNVAKHAHVPEAVVHLQNVAGNVELSVQDQGNGFDPTQLENEAVGDRFGLLSIRERLELLGGTLAINSTPGQGATLTAQIPHLAPIPSDAPASPAPAHAS